MANSISSLARNDSPKNFSRAIRSHLASADTQSLSLSLSLFRKVTSMAVPQGRPTSGPAEPPNDLRAETHAFAHARTRCVVRAGRMLATETISYKTDGYIIRKKRLVIKNRDQQERSYIYMYTRARARARAHTHTHTHTHEIYNYSNRKHYI